MQDPPAEERMKLGARQIETFERTLLKMHFNFALVLSTENHVDR
jgi:hypothetical protein